MRRHLTNHEPFRLFWRSVISFVVWVFIFGIFGAASAFADGTNDYSGMPSAPALQDTGLSFIRVMGALTLVLGLFLGGVWFFRNWQRLRVQSGHGPRLNVLESRSLGARQSLHVIGYENERYLIAASPAGINLLSHLPAATGNEPQSAAPAPPSFAEALRQVLKGK